MSNQQIFIIYTSEQKDILAAMDTIPFSSSSLNMSLSFWPFTHFHKGKKNTANEQFPSVQTPVAHCSHMIRCINHIQFIQSVSHSKDN